MIMKTTRYFVIALSSLLLLGCAKEMNAPEEQKPAVNQDLVSMTFKATVEDGATTTRTELNTSTGAVSWAEDDQIKLVWEVNKEMGDATSAALVAGDIVEGTATFSVEGVPSTFGESSFEGSSRHLYVLYPASLDYTYNNNLTFYLTVPAIQDGSFKNASIALAKWNDPRLVSGAKVDDPLEFKNLCGLLQIVIEDNNVRKIVINSDSYIAGQMNIGFPTSTEELRVKSVVDGAKSITVNVSGAGTYYVAVVPTNETLGTGLDNVYVELYNGNNELIGDRMANNAIPVARRQIRKLGPISTGLSDRLYFKAGGTGDGTSWDDAAGESTLVSSMKNVTSGTKELYLAAGTYTGTEISDQQINGNTAGFTIKVYGGYPAAATGKSLAGRDVSTNETLIESSSNKRLWRTTKGNWVFDGVSFKSQGYYSSNEAPGCAFLVLSGTESMLFRNCTFKESRHDGKSDKERNGAAVRVATTATFTNCKFVSNVSTYGYGGAVSVTSAGTFIANNCVFDGNDAKYAGRGGGAIFNNGGTVKLSKCDFLSNTASGTGSTGGAILVKSGSVFIDACNFRHVTEGSGGTSKAGGCYIEAEGGTVGVNNCVFAGSWGVGAIYQIQNAATMYIVNSTFNCQLGGGIVNNTGTCDIVNSIFLNSASGGDGVSFSNTSTLNLSYALYNKFGAGSATSETSCVTGIQGYTGGKVFPSWYAAGAAPIMKANDQSSTLAVSDCREYVRYYTWEGVIPDGSETTGELVKPTLTQVKTALGESDFLTWLGDAALSVDIRGVARNTDAMWPGSYQGE